MFVLRSRLLIIGSLTCSLCLSAIESNPVHFVSLLALVLVSEEMESVGEVRSGRRVPAAALSMRVLRENEVVLLWLSGVVAGSLGSIATLLFWRTILRSLREDQE